MYSFKCKSHPNILLIDHLNNVGNRCVSIIENKNINFIVSKDKLSYIAKVMGYTHDLGKSTSFFQNYLQDMIDKGESMVNEALRSHGLISALFTYYQLRKMDNRFSLLAFIAVKKHHGDIDNFDMEFNFKSTKIRNDKSLLNQQLMSINFEEFNNVLKYLELEKLDNADVILNLYDQIVEVSEEYIEKLERCGTKEDYIIFKLLFSILIFADKEDAIFHEANDIVYDIPSNIIDNYKSIIFRNDDTELSQIRNSIYDEVTKNIIRTQNRIMSFTVPTGTGKTLTSMAAALSLKKYLKEDLKIVYCLPFTSVIDQNYNVYCNVIKEVMGTEYCSNYRLLKHHHLSDLEYVSEKKFYESNQSRFLIENWNSQIIVTTFMQFFNTVFSNKNSNLVRYNSLADSIVLLDEVQSLPYRYWYAINQLFKMMTEKLNMYIVFITATQPLIFRGNEILELASSKEYYFNSFKRTKLHINCKGVFYDDFIEQLKSIIKSNDGKNILIILNTVRTAKDAFGKIKIYLDNIEDIDTELYFLSTGVIPRERRIRIEKIKNSKMRKIVVSTQLIEAGVDIDMDIVIRDMATLDSINQSAGRCNRENRGKYLGDVYIVNIVNDKNIDVWSFIYDSFLIEKTKQVICDKKIIYEENFLKMNEEYFTKVNENMSNDESKSLVNKINRLKFKDVNEDFKLIDEESKVSVFIEIDEEAERIWQNYLDIMMEENQLKRKERFDKIKRNFYDHVINVYKNKTHENELNGIMYVSYDSLKSSYDINTGYILQDCDLVF